MNKTLLSLCALSLAVSASTTHAAMYFKGALGNTLSTNVFNEEIEAFTPGFSGRDFIRDTVTLNQFTPSVSVGWNTKLSNLWGWGIEFDAQKPMSKLEYDVAGSFSESALPSEPNYNIQVESKYKLGLSAMVTLANSFYVKVGPSLLKQQLDLRVTHADTSASFTNSDSVNLVGVTGGAGFVYKVSRNFGLYTEYDYSYYGENSLNRFAVGATEFPGAGGTDSHVNRSLQTSQSEFHLGFVWSTCLL